MLKNFFKITLRNIWKSKTYSFLNIFGLAIGVACAGLIFLWIEDEQSFDQYANKDRIYQIRTNQVFDGDIRTFSSSPGPLATALKADIPAIEQVFRVQRAQTLFSIGEKKILQRGVYVDTGFFPAMQLKFIEGSAQNVFHELNSVVITKKIAAQFFGSSSHLVGQTIRVDNKQDFLISGVVEDVPLNATLQFDWLSPFEIIEKQRPWISNWNNNSVDTYYELKVGTDTAVFNQQLYGYLQKRDSTHTTRLIPFGMNDWRLRDKFENGQQQGGRIEYVHMFSVIAWIILFIACINFMNLATARSEKRMREVGVRKVLGAEKKGLIIQFIGESILMSSVAVIVGLLLVFLVLPLFNTIVEKEMVMQMNKPSHLLTAGGIALLCGLVAGSYPALYLSSFNPISVFKGLKTKHSGAVMIRKGLVVLQFTVSIVLIIGTIIIFQQIQHIKSRDLGYNRNNLISMDLQGDMKQQFNVIRQDMLATGVIENAGMNSYNTIFIGNNTTALTWQGKNPNADILISRRFVTPQLIPTLGLQLKEGRQFRDDVHSDSLNVIITEAFAKLLGEGSAIGKIIQRNGPPNEPQPSYTVIGVVKDFVYGDMYGQSDPVAFFSDPDEARFLYVKAKPQVPVAQVLAALETVMKKNNPAYPFQYTFVDDQFNARFKSEMLIGRLSRVFAALAIIISCLGLFGLAAYTAERRTKEIGIRKVLGASVPGITGLLSKDFLQLVGIATMIAFPLAWWAMNNWLQSYAYRISINLLVFVAAGAMAILIALLTISFQAIRAAIANPVKSLRTE